MYYARKIAIYHNEPNTAKNLCKSIDLVMQIELTQGILMPGPKFSEKFDHPFWHVFIFGNMFPESHGFLAMPVTYCIIATCSNLSRCY